MRTHIILVALVAGAWLGTAHADDGPTPEHEGHHKAIAACEGKSEGDPCSFATHDGNSIDGQCKTDREGKLACHPPHHHGHHGPPPQGQ